MIQLTPSSKILLGIKPLDFRKGMDSISRFIQSEFDSDSMSGSIFAFISRKGTQIRFLHYDGSGYWLCTKRLSKGIFWWPKSSSEKLSATSSKKMMMVLWGADPEKSEVYKDWRKIS